MIQSPSSPRGRPAGRRARLSLVSAFVTGMALVPAPAHAQGSSAQAGRQFTFPQILSYPYTEELTAGPTGARIAWVLNREGVRNIWAAEGPTFAPRQITSYQADDGQELTNLSISADGRFVVYVRGGDHDANWPPEGGVQPDPSHSPVQPKVEVWAVPFAGGTAKLLGEGDVPVLSPRGDRLVFTQGSQVMVMPVDGSTAAKRLLFARGTSESPVWSPTGDRLAFVSARGDHAFVGVFTSDSAPILFLAPSTSHDGSIRWSPDGRRIAFVRTPGTGGAPETNLDLHPRPWEIWSADASSGIAHRVWRSPVSLRGSMPTTLGGDNLAWGAGDHLVFLADLDGWPHLYSILEQGGEPVLLTPGAFMAEYVTLTPDRTAIVYNANTGTTPGDGDRRHLFRVPVDRATPVALTSGEGNEWSPHVTGDGATLAFIGADARRPPLPMVLPAAGGAPRTLGENTIPMEFPLAELVVPRPVTFRAADGTLVHGQLFERSDASASGAKKPAVVFVHGGPPRQMLLGWHYMGYYSNAYAVNQYLANHGYVVLSVNYRLGIGYGHDFQNPPHAGPWGAAEYQDVKAGGEYLQRLPQVDAHRVGIWGGSYGGLLTALALARNSDIFRAGVDLHGVHNWIAEYGQEALMAQLQYEKADIKRALDVAWKSSPVASIARWKSPVLLIQGDDDRNVRFQQTVDLARRLTAAGVPFEELVIPDEIHGFLRHQSWLAADAAIVDFFDRTLVRGVPLARR